MLFLSEIIAMSSYKQPSRWRRLASSSRFAILGGVAILRVVKAVAILVRLPRDSSGWKNNSKTGSPTPSSLVTELWMPSMGTKAWLIFSKRIGNGLPWRKRLERATSSCSLRRLARQMRRAGRHWRTKTAIVLSTPKPLASSRRRKTYLARTFFPMLATLR